MCVDQSSTMRRVKQLSNTVTSKKIHLVDTKIGFDF